MARMRPLYRYDNDRKEWVETNEKINVDEYLFRDVSSVDDIDWFDYSLAKVDGHLCNLQDIMKLDFVRENITALLMPVNYAYQEKGHTLFSNQINGDEITGVVRLTTIEDEEALEDAKKPGVVNSIRIGSSGQSGVTQYDVGGFLCIKDKKNYQFSGLKFDGHSEIVGHFGLKNPNQQNVIKGFGFVDRKPIVLWENFYNFNSVESMPTFEIKNGWLYESDKQKVYVGEGSYLKVYERRTSMEIPQGIEYTSTTPHYSSYIANISYYRNNASCWLYRVKDATKDIYTAPVTININSEIRMTDKLNQVYKHELRGFEYQECQDCVELDDLTNSDYPHMSWSEDRYIPIHGINNRTSGIFNGKEPWDQTITWYNEYNVANYNDAAIKDYGVSIGASSMQCEESIFVAIKPKIKYLTWMQHTSPSLTLHKTGTPLNGDLNVWYQGYNQPKFDNSETTYFEVSASVDVNYDWGLYDMVSIFKSCAIPLGGDRKTTHNSFVWESTPTSQPEEIIFATEGGDSPKGETREVSWGFHDITGRGYQSIGAFFGLRCYQKKASTSTWGSRYCVALEWD